MNHKTMVQFWAADGQDGSGLQQVYHLVSWKCRYVYVYYLFEIINLNSCLCSISTSFMTKVF